MPSPFPGIDPYLEPRLWRGFHSAFIVYARDALQPQLPARYCAEVNERLVLAAGQHYVEPDVAIVHRPMVRETTTVTYGSPPTAMELDEPVVFPTPLEDVFESYIEIRDLTGDRIVTSVELLSPTNKVPGPGRDSYLRKQDELVRAGANLVEIDLLRGGQRTVASGLTLGSYEPWYSVIAVWRAASQRHEAYFVQLDRRLPCIRIPLLPDRRRCRPRRAGRVHALLRRGAV